MFVMMLAALVSAAHANLKSSATSINPDGSALIMSPYVFLENKKLHLLEQSASLVCYQFGMEAVIDYQTKRSFFLNYQAINLRHDGTYEGPFESPEVLAWVRCSSPDSKEI